MAKKLQVIGDFPSNGDNTDAVKTINGTKPDEKGNVEIEVMTDEEVMVLLSAIQ